jgi:hypothetical protein
MYSRIATNQGIFQGIIFNGVLRASSFRSLLPSYFRRQTTTMRSSLALLSLSLAHGLAFAPPATNNCKFSTTRLSRPFSRSTDEYSRAEFLTKSVATSLSILPPFAHGSMANAFDGGVGGLGKTRPVTGVVFRDPEAAAGAGASLNGDDVTNELLAPDGTPAFVTFTAPWVRNKYDECYII